MAYADPVCQPCLYRTNEQELDAVGDLLSNTKHVCFRGAGGMGKTVLCKSFSERLQGQFDHLVCLDCNQGLGKSILFNEGLINNLGISLAKLSNNRLIKETLNAFNQVPGNILLVLDEFEEEQLLPELKSLHGWKLLLTSRKRLAETATHEIGTWLTEQAQKIYRFHEPPKAVTGEIFEAFFKLVDYNPLVIVLAAKMIRNSPGLDPAKFNEMFNSQSLDDEELKINIKVEGDGNTHLLHVLQKTFDVSKLKSEDSFFLMFLAVLPKDIKVTDLISWYGKKDAKSKKVSFNNLFNSLHDSGWLLRDGDDVHMHAMVQEAWLYRMQATGNFIQFMFQINWLAHRLREGIVGDFEQALQFLRYENLF